MPQIPATSPATGLPTPPSFLHTTSFSFVDTHGRTLLLRGVNLSGASKAPVGRLSHVLDGFWESAGADEDTDCWYGDEEDDEEAVADDDEDEDRDGESSGSGSGRSSRASSRSSGNGKGKAREKLSFVGRPLRLEDGSADVHLARLRGWGFNLLRFPFTWEALEHEGPGKYDYEFMDYTIQVLCKCKEYGFRVYMDPHQDTWSRFSGGSGAPFWTLSACGINPRHITATQAALLHCEYPSPYDPSGPTPATLPAMAWSTNYGRLLSQTVFTLFFAGRDFAPNCIIDGVNIQDYLQTHYIEACGQLADRIRAYDDAQIAAGVCRRGEGLLDACVIGWDSLNEPFEGLCGWADLSVNPTAQGSTLKKGTYPTPAQSLRLGMGQKQTVEHWTFGAFGPARDGVVEIDPKGRKVWADPAALPPDSESYSDSDWAGGELPDGTHPRWGWKRDVSKWPLGTCIWAQHGVWDVATGFVLRPAYFRTHPVTGVEVEFLSDYWKPHWLAYAARVRRAHPEAMVFVQPPVFAIPPAFTEEELGGRTAYAPHYYDGLTLVTRHWNWFNADALGLLRGKYTSALRAVKLGEGAIRKSLHEQLGYLQGDVSAASGVLGGDSTRGYPTVIGEIGTPFDMDGKRSYGWTDAGKHQGDYNAQEKALDASLQACDAWVLTKGKEREREREAGGSNGRGDSLNWTVWTYVPDDHSHEWGDGWNLEDLSLWSPDDVVRDDEEEECCCCCDDEDEAAVVRRQQQQQREAEGVYKDVQDMRIPRLSADNNELDDVVVGADGDTTTLRTDSRAVLLMDGEREADALASLAGAGAHASSALAIKCNCSPRNCTRRRRRPQISRAGSSAKLMKADRKLQRQQQEQQQQQPGRSLPMTAALSSLSLATLGSSTSLGVDVHALSQRVQRQRFTRAQSSAQQQDRQGRPGNARSRSKVSVASTATASSFDSERTSRSSLVKHHHHHRKSCPRHHLHAHSSSSSSSTANSTSSGIPLPLLRAGYDPNPYIFLTNGARAVRAFARPSPIAVVGRAVDVRFDVAKGVFKLVVWVGWEDRPPASSRNSGPRFQEERDGGEGEMEKRMPTEVFLPLVHYAHPRLLESARNAKGTTRRNSKEEKAKAMEKYAAQGNLKLRDERGRGGYPPTASMASLVPHDGDDEGGGQRRGASLESSVTTLAPTPVITSAPPPPHVRALEPVLRKSSEELSSPLSTTTVTNLISTPASVPMSASSTGASASTTAATLVSVITSAGAAKSGPKSSISTFTTTASSSKPVGSLFPPGIDPAARAPLLIGDTFSPSSSTLPSSPSSPSSDTDGDHDDDRRAHPLIDVEVTLSGGRYAIRGQRLFWWYDIPKEGDARREYVLEVKRRGGPVGVPPTKGPPSKDKDKKKKNGKEGWASASASMLSLFVSKEQVGEDKESRRRERERRRRQQQQGEDGEDKDRACCQSLCDEHGGLFGGCVIA